MRMWLPVRRNQTISETWKHFLYVEVVVFHLSNCFKYLEKKWSKWIVCKYSNACFSVCNLPQICIYIHMGFYLNFSWISWSDCVHQSPYLEYWLYNVYKMPNRHRLCPQKSSSKGSHDCKDKEKQNVLTTSCNLHCGKRWGGQGGCFVLWAPSSE